MSLILFSNFMKFRLNYLTFPDFLHLIVPLLEGTTLQGKGIQFYNRIMWLSHLHQPVVIRVQTTRVCLINFDYRDEIFVCHKYFVLMVQNASQVDASVNECQVRLHIDWSTREIGTHVMFPFHLSRNFNLLCNTEEGKHCISFKINMQNLI